MQITKGIIQGAQKVVCYGPEGIGKSYFASKSPNPLFIDTEGSTRHMDVARLPDPSSWTMLLGEVQHVKINPMICDTLIIDTADWTERLCKDHICSVNKVSSIEAFGYGKGYTYLAEEFGRLLNALTELIDLGVNVVLVAHASMRKFEQPDEMGAYDRWEMKLEKKVAALVKEWADMVLFANYQTFVINVDNQGAQKGKNKAQGGKRVMYTTHHPCWDAKNRHDLPDMLDFHFDEIKHCIPTRQSMNATPPQQQPAQTKTTPETPVQQSAPPTTPPPSPPAEPLKWGDVGTIYKNDTEFNAARAREQSELENLPKALTDLMEPEKVTIQEIQEVVAGKGYYPADTPISNYDPGFVQGVLIGAWPQVWQMISELRFNDDIPF